MQFNNLDEIQKYLQEQFAEAMSDSAEIERVLETAMREAVMKHVYDPYTPKGYERRGDNGGLSDVDNMHITGVFIEGRKVRLTFENLTEGNDNLKGEYTGDLIEFGEGHDGKHWNQVGEWSKPRRFSYEMAEELKRSPEELKMAIRSTMESRGFKFK